jgi:hypothetical protein
MEHEQSLIQNQKPACGGELQGRRVSPGITGISRLK